MGEGGLLSFRSLCLGRFSVKKRPESPDHNPTAPLPDTPAGGPTLGDLPGVFPWGNPLGGSLWGISRGDTPWGAPWGILQVDPPRGAPRGIPPGNHPEKSRRGIPQAPGGSPWGISHGESQGTPKSAAEMCGIPEVTILGSPRTLGWERGVYLVFGVSVWADFR